MAPIIEAVEQRGYDRYVVLDMADNSQLNLDIFDTECRKLSYDLNSTKITPTSFSSATFKPEHLSETDWKVTGESQLKFIVLGQKIYIFPEFTIHSTFLRDLKDRKVDGQLMDAGKITLKASIVKGENGEPKIEQTKRYLYGSSGSLFMRDEGRYRRGVLEPQLSAAFIFAEPRWGE